MNLKIYNKNKHENAISDTLSLHSMDPNLVNDLPEITLVAYEHELFVGIGSLRRIEGSYAMFDSYLTNPKVPADVRDHALDRITTKLLKIAKYKKITKVLAFSKDPHTITRAKKHGLITLEGNKLQVIAL